MSSLYILVPISLVLLAVVLEQQTELQPTQILRLTSTGVRV